MDENLLSKIRFRIERGSRLVIGCNALFMIVTSRGMPPFASLDATQVPLRVLRYTWEACRLSSHAMSAVKEHSPSVQCGRMFLFAGVLSQKSSNLILS